MSTSGGSSAGTVTSIASAGGTIVVTNGSGPAVNVETAILPGRFLATQVYAPATNVQYSVTTAMTAIDTTNATIAFVVPASGIVDVEVDLFYYGSTGGTASGALSFALLNHTGGAQIGGSIPVVNLDLVSQQVAFAVHLTFHLSGLTAGALQVDLAAAKVVSSTCNYVLQFQASTGPTTGAQGGPLVMRAVASI